MRVSQRNGSTSPLLGKAPSKRRMPETVGDNRGLHPIHLFRLSQRLHARGHRRTAHLIKSLNYLAFHTILPPEVEGGYGLQLNHRALSVVIHPLTTLGEGVRIQHGVTIANRTTIRSGARTVIGNDVRIGAGAIILGPLRISDRAVIGAGAIVTKDVPAGEVWAGNPARRIR
jgi:serine O-acetyltransferase